MNQAPPAAGAGGGSAEPAAPPAADSRARRARRLAGFAAGAALLAAAVWAVLTQGDAARAAWQAARHAPPWLVAAALLLPLANWLVISVSFWVLMRRHGEIRPAEMAQLIGAAWLLNYLPLRPGMIGRVAYHKSVNRIAIGHSVRVMVVGMAAAGAAVLTLLAVAAALGPGATTPAWAAALAAPALAAGAAAALMSRGPWWLAVTYLLRYADVLLWTARYWVVFSLVGAPVDLAGAVAIAAVCQVALVIPIVGNGLGFREWAVALVATSLPAGFAAGGSISTGAGLAADLANRAAELVIAVPVGLICASALAARRR